MKPNELLDHLTAPPPGDVHALVAAAGARASLRHRVRETAAAALIVTAAAGGLAALLRPQLKQPVAGAQINVPPPLTSEELLDSFGDQPVALVTYPDGSQRLLAIIR